jgi:carbamoyltransferase
MRDHINTVLKDREWFMPFAPSILEEDGPRYLEGYFYSPFMTHAFAVTAEARRDLFSAVHLDGTARPQIVRRSVLPHYHAILTAFKERTGVGGVLNTSFNRHGLPIVNDPRDAVNHLLWGCVDALALGPFLVRRKGPPVPYKKRLPWSTDEIIKKWEPFDERLQRIRERRKNEGPAGDPA